MVPFCFKEIHSNMRHLEIARRRMLAEQQALEEVNTVTDVVAPVQASVVEEIKSTQVEEVVAKEVTPEPTVEEPVKKAVVPTKKKTV